jgi:type II secretory pathway pseudopilin PulG
VSGRAKAAAGFTLVELAVSMTLMAALLGTAALLAQTSLDLFRLRSAEEALALRAEGMALVIAHDLAGAARAQLLPPPLAPYGTSNLAYRSVRGYAGGAVVLGASERFAFEYENGELDDGLDNNGNGLVDEGVVIWTSDDGAGDVQRVVRCHGVVELAPGELPNGLDDDGDGLRDEGGLSFELQGDLLTVSLSLQERGPGGRLLSKSARTSIHLRNS